MGTRCTEEMARDVQEKHEDYVIIKEGDDISDKDHEWMTKEAQRFQDIEIKVDTYIEKVEKGRIIEEEIRRNEACTRSRETEEYSTYTNKGSK